MAQAPNYLTAPQFLALGAWRSAMRQLFELAGRPDQAQGCIDRGMTMRQAHAMLVEAAAEQLPSDWDLAHQEIAKLRHQPDDAEDVLDAGADQQAATSGTEAMSFTDQDEAAARSYAAEIGGLCRLAGFPERSAEFLASGISIRVLRTRLQELQRARVDAVGYISNAHNAPLVPSGATLPSATAIYRRRAREMGQTHLEPRQ